MKIRYPRLAVRRRRAERANATWATPSHKIRNARDANFRNVLNWLDGYEACMRDVRAQLQGASIIKPAPVSFSHRRYYYGRSLRAACCTGTVRNDRADEVMATCEQHNAPLHWEDDEL